MDMDQSFFFHLTERMNSAIKKRTSGQLETEIPED